jgi:hypothetical protein
MELTTTPPYPIFIHWIQTTPSPFNLLSLSTTLKSEREGERKKEHGRELLSTKTLVFFEEGGE